MVKRLFLLSLMVLALCGASTVIALAGGPPVRCPSYMPATSVSPADVRAGRHRLLFAERADRSCSRPITTGQSCRPLSGRCGLAAYSACLLREPPNFSQPYSAWPL